ncbi:MAG: alanine racemase C-terminal domain-containing protein, partial [Mariprofundaceae bacterium]
VRDLAAGESVSYGASFTAPAPMRIAIVRAGYADGLPRALSNRGQAALGGRRLPVLGRVCMDYTIIGLEDAPARPGDTVQFWGDALPPDAAADAAGTIPYTLFTGVSARVRREMIPAPRA